MSVVSDFQNELDSFGNYDVATEKYTSGAAFKFDIACQNAKVDVDEILANLIIIDKKAAKMTDAEKEKNERINGVLSSMDITPAFNPGSSRDNKIKWVLKHLSMAQKITVLAEVELWVPVEP